MRRTTASTGSSLGGVTDASGRANRVSTSESNGLYHFRIGDPNRTVSGNQTYRLSYTLSGAFNGFADHDELYWNATGNWQVAVREASAVLHVPGGGLERADCFQGPVGSTERCTSEVTPDRITFTTTRPLAAGEGMTIVAWLRKGIVPDPSPRLVAHRGARTVPELIGTSPIVRGVALAGVLAVIGSLGTVWWRFGRDKRYVSVQYLAQDEHGAEERVPLFGARPIAVEFEPPEAIRPGQVGVLLDERADTLDVTATIVDLAVRGYLTITEVPKHGWFGRTDWQLDRLDKPDTDLLEYERIVLEGLFNTGRSRRLSDLKRKFYKDLARAQKSLYADAVARGWFRFNPNTVRTVWRIGGVLLVAAGMPVFIVLGARWGAGLLAAPVALAGVGLLLVSRAMPRRTARGHELLHRTLGFVRYVKTAETHQQEFAERAGIFTAYLPYAIVFRCVDRWAHAFRDIDLQAATTSWYTGTTAFNAATFSSSLSGFSSSVSSAIASTPGGSGGSGFSGGSSGGGGGGGGGGSW